MRETAIGTSQSQNSNKGSASLFESMGAGIGGNPGRQDIIDQENSLVANGCRIGYGNGAPQIAAPRDATKAGLGRSFPNSRKERADRDAQQRGDLAAEQFGLVEAALSEAAFVNRNRNDAIHRQIAGDAGTKEVAQGFGQAFHGVELVVMDELAECAVVEAGTEHGVVLGNAGAAKPAAAIVIKSGFGAKGGGALNAKKVGGKRRRRGETGRAEGVTRKRGQAGTTNAAIVGKRKRKGTRGGISGYSMSRLNSTPGSRQQRAHQRFGRIYEVASKVGREDVPPRKL